MEVNQFRYSADNFSYVVHGEKSALVIDGGAVQEILSFLDQYRLKAEFIVNTHSHPDHTVGTDTMVKRSGAAYLDNHILRKNKFIQLEGESIQVYHTPGHTEDSLTFHAGKILITGDTLFNGTIGNCFSGDIEGFFKSVKMLTAFPGETIVYAGHDYVKESAAFAKFLEPDNPDIDLFLENYNPSHVYSTLSQELKVNPYLRFNDAKMTEVLKRRGLPVETEYDRWKSLMSIE